MTEEEAKTKPCIAPCPFNVGRLERYQDGTFVYFCIGSPCLAWRWEQEIETDYDDRGYASARHQVATSDGYCGIAGKP